MLEYLLPRALESDCEMERVQVYIYNIYYDVQAYKCVYCVVVQHPTSCTRPLVSCLCSLSEVTDDPLSRTCIVNLCSLGTVLYIIISCTAITNPLLLISCGALRFIVDAVSEPRYNNVCDCLVDACTYMYDMPQSRAHIKPSVDFAVRDRHEVLNYSHFGHHSWRQPLRRRSGVRSGAVRDVQCCACAGHGQDLL